jgi:purine-binding chemotaxis protein CheW
MEMNTSQYLTFTLGEEEYAVEVQRVQEIKAYPAITSIPNAPSFIRGLMNLRGSVVPVIGLRETFGLAPVPYDKLSVIVVLNVGARVIGLLVDSVTDVVDLAPSQIEMPPELGARVDTSYITGVAQAGDKFVILISIEKLVSGVDLVTESLPAPEEFAIAEAAG